MTTTCDRQDEVVTAFLAGRLEQMPALAEHADHCGECGRAMLFSLAADAYDAGALSAPSGGPPSGLEAALQVGFGGSDDEAPDEAGSAAEDGRADVVRLTPAALRGRRRMVPWIAGVALAAGVVLAVGLADRVGEGGEDDGWPPPAPELVARGHMVGMELGVGDRRCVGVRDPAGWAFTMGAAAPCRWQASDEIFTMNVRIEPDADTRYVAVLALDEHGETTLLYPGEDVVPAPLASTRGRGEGCIEDLCWLEGGRYDVSPGRLSVVAVFSKTPLPTAEMAGKWAPWRWAGPDRLVERFELEVLP